MRRIDLPGGHWADLRDKEEITTRGRRGITAISVTIADALPKIQAASPDDDLSSLGLTEAEVDALMRIQEATVVAFLAAWSLPDPLPTLATVGDIPAALYDVLSAATAADGAQVGGLTLDTGTGGTVDPKDPTGGSAT